MKYLVFLFLLIALPCFAQATYTGRAENVTSNDRGVVFTVVVDDGEGKEVLRRDQWVSTGNMSADEAVAAVKNVVDRMTQEMWAHKEGIKDALKQKTQIEAYRATCDTYTEPTTRPDPQDTRP